MLPGFIVQIKYMNILYQNLLHVKTLDNLYYFSFMGGGDFTLIKSIVARSNYQTFSIAILITIILKAVLLAYNCQELASRKAIQLLSRHSLKLTPLSLKGLFYE